MKKILLITAIIAFTTSSAQETFTKREHILKSFGNNGYAGWYLMIQYDVNEKSKPMSDTTFVVMTNSAAYTQITDPFIMFTTNDKNEFKGFFDTMFERLSSIPNQSAIDFNENIRFRREENILTVIMNNTNRTDRFAFFNKVLYKRIKKALRKIN